MNDKPTYQELENQIAELQNQNQTLHLNSSIKTNEKEKQAEKEIKQSKIFLENVFESVLHPFCVINVEDYSIEMSNSAAKNSAIKNSNNNNLTTCYYLTHGNDKPCDEYGEHCPLKETVESGKPTIVEHLHRKKDGKLDYVEVHTYPIFGDDGKVSKIIEYSLDISKRKLVEEKLIQLNNKLKELIATRDRLFSIIAHDLRSPFTSILGFSEILIENIRDLEITKTEEFIKDINTSAQNTLYLLDNLLNWAKTQTGNIIVQPKKINLSSIIQETIDLLNAPANIKSISLNLIQPDKIEIYVDENMVKTVLRNLISNAIKFTNLGGNIDVSAISEGDQVEIIISDNGVGMNEDTQKSLFNISVKTTTPGTADEKGSGLGLVLCKEFTEMLGGSIWVESEEGKGSDFKFTLPLNRS